MAHPKRAKRDNQHSAEAELAQAATTAWEHYRNYSDSLDNNPDGDGDVDELEELLSVVLHPHVKSGAIQPLQSLRDLTRGSTPTSTLLLLPILMSVSYCHLATAAIEECMRREGDGTAEESLVQQCQALVDQSLHWYPENAAMWSLGANFGRMFQVLSPASVVRWYETAVEFAAMVREESLKLLEEDGEASPEIKEWIELLLLNRVVGVEYLVDEDQDNSVEEGKESNNADDDGKGTSHKRKADEDEEGYFSASSVEATSRFMAAMLHSTAGQHNTAKQHLERFPVTHRVHPHVWQPPEPITTEQTDKAVQYHSPDGILPAQLYQRLCQVFSPQAAYWRESDYDRRGYYSYFMDKPQNKSKSGFHVVTNLVDDIIWNHLYPLLSLVQANETIVGAEWWVHTRAIQANLGHNLHFDTDEALLNQEARVTHPIYSSVLYLTGGGESGGATIVFDQTPNSKQVAEKAWRCVPEDNSLLLFHGDLLHGVLPCPGSSKQTGNVQTSTLSIQQEWIRRAADQETTPHRLSFMVGFWTRRVPDAMQNRHLYGPCGPLPPRPTENDDEEKHTWVEEIYQGYNSQAEPAKPQSNISTKAVPVIAPAWEVLKPASEDRKHEEESSTSILEIPKGIDHRFFVTGAPKCFWESLFERGEDGDGDDEEGDC